MTNPTLTAFTLESNSLPSLSHSRTCLNPTRPLSLCVLVQLYASLRHINGILLRSLLLIQRVLEYLCFIAFPQEPPANLPSSLLFLFVPMRIHPSNLWFPYFEFVVFQFPHFLSSLSFLLCNRPL